MKHLSKDKILSPLMIYLKVKKGIEVMHILLVENNATLVKDLSKVFNQNHYRLDTVTNGADGLLYARSNIYDLILFNPTLPDLDEIHFIITLRQEHIITPLILLAGYADTQDMIRALEAGADDYFIPPMHPDLFLARIHALSRRNTVYHGNILTFEDLLLNIGTMELSCQQKSVKLGLKEMKLCELFLSSPTQIIPKNLLIEKIWGIESDANYNNVEVYVSFLRHKMKSLNTKTQIKTIRGVGYQLMT